ncbi:MAG: hypothetical protein AB7E77_09205 [Desulfobulbus sp.]
MPFRASSCTVSVIHAFSNFMFLPIHYYGWPRNFRKQRKSKHRKRTGREQQQSVLTLFLQERYRLDDLIARASAHPALPGKNDGTGTAIFFAPAPDTDTVRKTVFSRTEANTYRKKKQFFSP